MDRLRQDVAHTPINYNLLVWDIRLITTLSINDAIRMPLLHQHSLTLIASIVSSIVARYATTDQHSILAKCISFGYWYIRAYVESTEGLPWVEQTVDAGLLSAVISTEPWFEHLNGQYSEDWEPLFLYFVEIIPKYSLYSSVLKTMIKQLTAIDVDGLLFQGWSVFELIIRRRVVLYNSAAVNETHIESCQNAKVCPPRSFHMSSASFTHRFI